MAQPILSIKDNQETPKAVANLLPCRVHHNGSVDPASSYWSPTTAEDGSQIAYFRGRKLHGKTVKLPEQCRGVVVERVPEPTARAQNPDPDNMENEGEPLGGKGSMNVTAKFDEIVIWGHEAVADAAGDPYVRSMEEWLDVANQIHAYDDDDQKQK